MPKRPARERRRPPSPLIYLMIPLAFLLGLGTGNFLWADASGSQRDANQLLNMSALVDDDPSLGPDDAPVVIVEFSDYQCPYCQIWHQQVFPQIVQAYGDQVRFVYRDLPIPGHPQALPAAIAANCAGEQGSYWQFHDRLFSGVYDLGRSAYEMYAQELNLDVEEFTACLDSGRNQTEPQQDYQDAQRIGVNSTPTFVINGQIVVGAQPFEAFQSVIDDALAAGQ